MKTALLLSGGMDSIAIAYWCRPEIAFTVNYGQKPAEAEIRAAKAVAMSLSIEHHIISVDLAFLGSGDMAGTRALPIAHVSEWWPFRNQMLVTLAATRAVAMDVNRLLIGTLSTDGRHADGTKQFVDAMSKVLELQEGAIKLEAPSIGLSAIELLRKSQIPMELLAWAHSCHVGEYACGQCRGCQKHFETLSEHGVGAY